MVWYDTAVRALGVSQLGLELRIDERSRNVH